MASMNLVVIFCLSLIFLTSSSDSSKILAIFPMAAPSHYILGNALLRGLAEAGHDVTRQYSWLKMSVSDDWGRAGLLPFTPIHRCRPGTSLVQGGRAYFTSAPLTNVSGADDFGPPPWGDVTMISPYSESNPPKKGSYRDIVLTGFIEKQQQMRKDYDPFMAEDKSPLLLTLLLAYFSDMMTESTLNHMNVQDLIKSNEKFDVVIAGQFANDAIKAFSTHFNAHLIIFSSLYANSMMNHLVGNPSLPSFAPEVFSDFPPRMSFFQRLYNTLIKFTFYITHQTFTYSQQNKLIKKYFPNPVDLDDVMYNASLVLLNSHPSISTPQPYVPCMIDIGGFHVQPPKKLPDDLQTFLDNAKEGVIYFSMGSNLKSKNLPEEKRNAILKAFSKLKEKVLWKWEDDVLPGQPPNVKLGKWLPQQDILAHPNVKVFITHGGLLSTTETVYHGVPIIAIPIFGDQKVNANSAKIAGYGKVLPFQEVSEEKLLSVLKEVLTDSKYREEAQRRSKIMRDRQVQPLDNAIYWVEYVIRHNGAQHLKVPFLDLMWYQYYLLDVFAFILVVIVGAYLISKRLISYCIRKARKTKLKTN